MSTYKEDTLKQLHNIYVDSSYGLVEIGKKLGLHLFAPRRKMNVLLIGNHSSGKSSFINWYVDAKIQKTGVAIETQGFTMITSGKTRETLTGKATMHLYPYLKPLESIKGVLPYLTTELTPSNSRRFNLVTFIDTPGLADGELHYPYDIERALIWLGDIADLIFVFFDPIGQALCKRTLNVVERLNNLYSERMRFFLSKADEAGDESDRQKVMMQIVQELCKRPGLNQSGFEMMAIYLPNQPDLKVRERMCVNQIEDTCKEIDKTIALTIQNTFNIMEKDIKQLEELVDSKLNKYRMNMIRNIKNAFKLLFVAFLCLQFPISALIYQQFGGGKTKHLNVVEGFYSILFDNVNSSSYYKIDIIVNLISRMIFTYMMFIARIMVFMFPNDDYLLLYSFLLSIPMMFIAKYFITFKQTITIGEMRQCKDIRLHLQKHRQTREKLFSQYLNEMINDLDL